MNFLNKIKQRYTININKEIKIFYVEDEIYYSKLLHANLKKIGFNDITAFISGEELLSEIEKGLTPDIIILDYIIKGGMNAFEIITEIKKYNLNTEIIILSGQSDVEKATMIIKNGATDYIVKNNMTFFNLQNSLLKSKKVIYNKLESTIKLRRSKIAYITAIFFIWFILVFVLFFKITSL